MTNLTFEIDDEDGNVKGPALYDSLSVGPYTLDRFGFVLLSIIGYIYSCKSFLLERVYPLFIHIISILEKDCSVIRFKHSSKFVSSLYMTIAEILGLFIIYSLRIYSSFCITFFVSDFSLNIGLTNIIVQFSFLN